MKNLNAYKEDYASPEAIDPNESFADFAWDDLYASLGEEKEHDGSRDCHTLSRPMAALMRWLLRSSGEEVVPELIGTRTLALAMVMTPDLIHSNPVLARIAADCGIYKHAIESPKSSQTHPNESNPGNQPVPASHAGNEAHETTSPVKSRPVRLNQRT